MQVTRVLDPVPFIRLDDYVDNGGFDGLRSAQRVEPAIVVETISDAGLRGRGGAGFPTGTKWQTVIDQRVGRNEPITVVVNAAEGEPGSFKDRAILAANPYRVLEGALIAAHAVGADRVVVAVKESFTSTIDALVHGDRRDRGSRVRRRRSDRYCTRARSSTCSARNRRCSRSSTGARRSLG